MKTVIVTVLSVFAAAIIFVVVVKNVQLKQNCTGYLKRAADANTVETAKEQLQKSIHYLEANNLTSGYTSILWQTPDEDIEFWYKNLKASENELLKIDSSTSTLEKTNLLMKLRETLLDNGKDGDKLTIPSGLSRYPNNGIFAILILISVTIIISLIIYGSIKLENY